MPSPTTSAAPPVLFDPSDLAPIAARLREPCTIVEQQTPTGARRGVAPGPVSGPYQTVGTLPALYPEWLGDRSFQDAHGVRFPYVTGAMANGIASVELVIAAARAGFLGFFGSAGLSIPRVEEAFARLDAALGDTPYGMNLIHSPHEPDLEQAVVDLYLTRGVTNVSASAYMGLTKMVVQYAYTGVSLSPDGKIQRRNALFAKISRPEVAERFLRPAPEAMLQQLKSEGRLTDEEVTLARRLPVAEDITVESDSGGHTDNQILTAVFPTVAQVKTAVCAELGYERPVRVGAAGGLGTPDAVAAAFSLGAAYVVTGSVNQAAIESGLSARGKALLCQAAIDDVMMAPAADMFEMGVKVQVLKRGAMFAVRAHRLWDTYRAYASIEHIPEQERLALEKEIFQDTLANVWAGTEAFFAKRDPSQNVRAQKEPKHKMALCFRWYLGQASKWAIAGDEGRALDYQIWCGPAMGAFNRWVQGSFLQAPEARTVEQIGKNLLEGACVIKRAFDLRAAGLPVPDAAFRVTPHKLA